MSRLTHAVAQFLDLMNWEDEIRVEGKRGCTSTMAKGVTIDAQPWGIRYVHEMDFEDCEPSGKGLQNVAQASFALFRRGLGQLAEVAITPRTAAEILASSEGGSQAGAGQGAADGVPEAP